MQMVAIFRNTITCMDEVYKTLHQDRCHWIQYTPSGASQQLELVLSGSVHLDPVLVMQNPTTPPYLQGLFQAFSSSVKNYAV